MKFLKLNHLTPLSVACLLTVSTLFILGCEKRKVEDLEKATFPAKGIVFIDDFTPDLVYAAFGGSDVRAFQVDKSVTYNNSSQSMRFDVPDPESPNGSYAGGVFMSSKGRDLSGFNALTFYIRASRPVSIGTLGFGNDFGANKYLVTLSGLPVTSNWVKVVVPIPNPSKLTAEKGLFYFAASPAGNGDRGYTFWVDELKFERVGNLGIPQSVMLLGDSRVADVEVGQTISIEGFKTSVILPTGVSQTVDVTPGHFEFKSSDPAVATVNEFGLVTILSAGEATITARVNNMDAGGKLTIKAGSGAPVPLVAAPTPNRPAADVISMYSNAYTNVPVDTWNTRWESSTAEEEMIQIQGNDAIRYRNLNFVGIEFTSQKINATNMDVFHLDIWTPDATDTPNEFRVKLVDFGANGNFGGGDDREGEVTINRGSGLVSNNWVSINIPLSAFGGLSTRANLAQLVLSGTVPNVYVDNVYFYKSNQSTSPTTPAPTPTYPAAGVLSLFSDAYTNLAGLNLDPDWGQATNVSQTPIGGNNTMVYTGLNYQGLEFGSEQNVSNKNFLHIDYYSVNSLSLKVFVLSPGVPLPEEISYTLPVPTTSGWNSIDIPLSHFRSPINLSRAYQLKFEGNGTIYLDNILFRE